MSPPRPGLRKNRDFVRLWTALAARDLGMNTTAVALPLLSIMIVGAQATGLVVACMTIGTLGTLLIAGAAVDRVSRKATIVVALASRVVLLVVLTVAFATEYLEPWLLVAIVFLLGVAAAPIGPAQLAAVRAVVPQENWDRAISQNMVRSSIAQILGNSVGGLLYNASKLLPWAADIVASIVAIIAVSRIRNKIGRPSTKSTPAIRVVTDGFRFAFQSPLLRLLLVITSIVNFASFWPAAVVVLDSNGVQPSTIGLIAALLGVCGVLGSASAPAITKRVSTQKLLSACVAGNAGCLVSIAVMPTPTAMVILISITSFLTAVFAVASATLEALATPDELVGRVNAIYRFAAMLSIPVGQALGTVWVATLGPGTAFLFFSIPQFVAATLLLALPSFRLALADLERRRNRSQRHSV